MTVVGFKAHKKADEGQAWDGSAARKRLEEWAGGDQVDWSKFQQGFAWFEAEKKETLGAYKLPHSDVIDGDICDVWKGVAAAMSALLGGRGGTDIPEGDRKGAYNHLAQHYKQFDKEPPEFRAEAEQEALSTARAPFMPDAAAVSQTRLQAALDTINARFAKKPLTEEEIFLLPPAEMSNKNIDAYFTRMAESSLRNYWADALDGVPLMNSHRTGGLLTDAELPLGSSYNAVLEESSNNLRLVVYYYMLRGLEINGLRTDQLVRAIDGGVVRDVSIGFHGGHYVCGLCGKPLLTWSALMSLGNAEDAEDIEEQFCCDHVPGVAYDGKLAFSWVEDAHLVEGSLVYAGATPEAVLRQARFMVGSGRLARGEATVLEDRWGVRIIPASQFAPLRGLRGSVKRTGAEKTSPVKEGQTREEVGREMTVEEIRALVAERAPELADRLAEVEEPVAALLDAWADMRAMAAQQAENLQARIAELEQLAADGTAHRKALVDQAVATRVRAQGNAFDAEAYRALLLGQPLEYVQGEIAAWEKTAREVFEPGAPVGKVLSRGGEAQAPRGTSGEPGRSPEAYKA